MANKRRYLTDPAMHVMIEQASAYYQDVMALTGHPPERYMVTEAQYTWLQECLGTEELMSIFGLPICRPNGMRTALGQSNGE